MAVSMIMVGLTWYFKDSMYSYVFTEEGELRRKRRLALMSLIPIITFMLLAAAIYSCCVKMRHRLEDDEKRSNHPLELSDKAASIWDELSEPTTSTSTKKTVKEDTETKETDEGQGKDGKPNEDKQQQQLTGKSSNDLSKKSNDINSK